MENKIYLIIDDDLSTPSVREQMETQGYRLGDKKDYEDLIEDVKKLYINGVITLKERNKCIKRIFKEMFSDSEKIA